MIPHNISEKQITTNSNHPQKLLGSDTNLTQSNPNILISPNLALKINNGSLDQLPPASNPGAPVNTVKAVKDQVRKLVEY